MVRRSIARLVPHTAATRIGAPPHRTSLADTPVERNDYAFAIVQPDADLTACACTSGHCVPPSRSVLRSIYRQGGRCVWVTRACLPYARTCASVIAEVLTSAWLMIFA
jgi:hypothetical protein